MAYLGICNTFGLKALVPAMLVPIALTVAFQNANATPEPIVQISAYLAFGAAQLGAGFGYATGEVMKYKMKKNNVGWMEGGKRLRRAQAIAYSASIPIVLGINTFVATTDWSKTEHKEPEPLTSVIMSSTELTPRPRLGRRPWPQ